MSGPHATLAAAHAAEDAEHRERIRIATAHRAGIEWERKAEEAGARYDYVRQAWIDREGTVLACGHVLPQVRCYACHHAGAGAEAGQP